MVDSTKNILFLTFKNRNLETAFQRDYDYTHRISNRAGIYLSIITWCVNIIAAYFLWPQNIVEIIIVVATLLLPLFIVVIIITQIDRYVSLYQPLSGIANLIAALVYSYFACILVQSYAYLSFGNLLLLCFAFFILRIRFKLAVLIALLYNSIAQVLLIFSGNFTKYEIVFSTFAIWIGFFIISLAGYILEHSGRKVFIQSKIIEEQREEILREQEKSERLLLNILPEEIAKRLKQKEEIIADSFENVSVLFADIAGFTSMSSSLSAEDVVSFLNDLFLEYDNIVDKYDIEKIKTIGDAYMVVAGVPKKLKNHAEIMADFSIDMMEATRLYRKKNNNNINVRIGINSGPVVAGVIGRKKFLYDLWGDTVNTASRMESNGLPGRIQVTENTYNLLKGDYYFEERGSIEVKGKGKIATYFLTGKKESIS